MFPKYAPLAGYPELCKYLELIQRAAPIIPLSTSSNLVAEVYGVSSYAEIPKKLFLSLAILLLPHALSKALCATRYKALTPYLCSAALNVAPLPANLLSLAPIRLYSLLISAAV